MKKFRVKNLTVAVGADKELKRCGANFSCPGGAGSICGVTNFCRFPTHINCGGFSNQCQIFSPGCGGQGITFGCPQTSFACPQTTLGCPQASFECLISRGCGVNFSTLPPTDFTQLILEVDDVTDRLELIDLMKADLNDALQNIDAAEKEFAKAAQPQTLAEAKEVEKNLESALAEVKGLVKDLK